MVDVLILRNILQNYISEQSDIDRQILNLFVKDEYTEHEIVRITGYSLPKISRVIRKLRAYLRKLKYC